MLTDPIVHDQGPTFVEFPSDIKMDKYDNEDMNMHNTLVKDTQFTSMRNLEQYKTCLGMTNDAVGFLEEEETDY